MKAAMIRAICRLLVVSLMVLPLQTVQAGVIGTEQALTAGGALAERMAVLDILIRPEVASQLQALGVDPKSARERVAAMTDDEIRSLAGKLDSLPAGAKHRHGAWFAVAMIVALVIVINWK